MATTTLVEFPREAVNNLLNDLDKKGLSITAAFWEFRPDDEAWRLILATPEVASRGPLSLIREIRQTLDALSDEERDGLSVLQIALYNPQQIKIREMQARYGVVEHEQDHSDRWKIYSRSEPYIYRLLPS